jgi:hypothetical protein
MKTILPSPRVLVSVLLLAGMWKQAGAQTQFREPVARPWAAAPRNAFETVWTSTSLTTNAITQKVYERKHSYIQLGTALNLAQPGGTFRPSNPSFTITANGAEAQNTIHKVVLAPDINVEGAVQVTTSDGAILRSNPIGFGYYDPVSGRNAIVGTLTNSVGWLISSNEVVYSNCFAGGVRASVHYRNLKGAFSQNLILHEQIPPPEAFQLSARSRLELFTQFTADTPLPTQSVRTLSSETNSTTRATMASPDFTDATLSFGTMRMVRGPRVRSGWQCHPPCGRAARACGQVVPGD